MPSPNSLSVMPTPMLGPYHALHCAVLYCTTLHELPSASLTCAAALYAPDSAYIAVSSSNNIPACSVSCSPLSLPSPHAHEGAAALACWPCMPSHYRKKILCAGSMRPQHPGAKSEAGKRTHTRFHAAVCRCMASAGKAARAPCAVENLRPIFCNVAFLLACGNTCGGANGKRQTRGLSSGRHGN